MTHPPSRTFCEAFQQTAAKHPDAVALRTPGDETSVTWRGYADRVARIASGLSAIGVRRGDTVALMMGNRPEFHILDTAALHAGAVPFSIYNTLAPEQIAYLFSNAGNRVVICEEQYVEQLRAANVGGQVERIVCIDANPAGTTTLAELEANGDPAFDFEASWRAVEPGDVLTIIYTSGTTGPPKGVEITHQAVLEGVRGFQELLPTGSDDRVISYLPDAHIANRWGVHYANLSSGIQVTTVSDPKQLIATLPSVRPTFFAAVPQIWYKLKAAIEAAVEQEPNPVKRSLGLWAIRVGTQVAWLESDGNKVPVTHLAARPGRATGAQQAAREARSRPGPHRRIRGGRHRPRRARLRARSRTARE